MLLGTVTGNYIELLGTIIPVTLPVIFGKFEN